MIKTTLIVLAGAGIVGTGSQTVTPQAFEISAGNVAYEITKDGIDVERNETPEFGVSFVTKGKKQLTIRF